MSRMMTRGVSFTGNTLCLSRLVAVDDVRGCGYDYNLSGGEDGDAIEFSIIGTKKIYLTKKLEGDLLIFTDTGIWVIECIKKVTPSNIVLKREISILFSTAPFCEIHVCSNYKACLLFIFNNTIQVIRKNHIKNTIEWVSLEEHDGVIDHLNKQECLKERQAQDWDEAYNEGRKDALEEAEDREIIEEPKKIDPIAMSTGNSIEYTLFEMSKQINEIIDWINKQESE